ncbi:MAG: DUF5723 family protein [Flavobacterium sp.]
MTAQDHFSGLKNSNGFTLLSSSMNPAELSNLTSTYEINFFSASINASNNKVGFNDLINNSNTIADLIFQGNAPVNLRIDAEIYGPGFAMKKDKWAFAISSKAYAKLNFIDIDPKLGEAVNKGTLGSIVGTSLLNNENNQRVNGTSWGEIGFSAARNLFENDKNKFSIGTSLKLLFPGSYTNFGADKFQGKINVVVGEAYLNDTKANLNIAYSGNLNNGFTDFRNYSESLFGKLNGFAVDLGFNYQLKDTDGYKFNAGISVKNIGGMTFKGANNASNNYALNIPPSSTNGLGLNLNDFQNVKSLDEAETILINSGYLINKQSNQNIKVKLPSTFIAYVDVKVVPKFFVSLYTEQKLNSDSQNDQITTQNVVSVTPRFSLKNYDLYSSWSNNEISGITGGFGCRVYGFYLGSSSIITALTSTSKQADLYLGYRLKLK